MVGRLCSLGLYIVTSGSSLIGSSTLASPLNMMWMGASKLFGWPAGSPLGFVTVRLSPGFIKLLDATLWRLLRLFYGLLCTPSASSMASGIG